MTPYVGQDLPHESAPGHVSGSSRFVDDIPPRSDELFLELYGGTIPHGTLRSIDLTAARGIPGVVVVLTAEDIPGRNDYGPIVRDDRLLALGTVRFVGEPIAVVAATSRDAARRGRSLIRTEITPLSAVLSLEQARASQEFLGPERKIETGDPNTALASAPFRMRGSLRIDGQEQFYLESQAAIAYPEENSTISVVSSTQHPSEVQAVVAEVLGVAFNQITVRCPRMGGGFGGKETQAAQFAALAALVAAKTGRPARIVLDRDQDMAITGKRHPFLAEYDVGFNDRGEILALAVDLIADGGCSTDLSPSVLERAMMHLDNAYFLPAVRITGRIVRTNFPSNTAFRGFGGPQGVACIEHILGEIANRLTMDPYDVRVVNCYGAAPRDTTPYGQLVKDNGLPEIFSRLRKESEYDRRRKELTGQRSEDPNRLRGIAMTAVKFGIAFTKRTLNQANALVHVFTDGSITVTTGATEMGQGVQTRIRQLVADDMGVPLNKVRIGETSTDKNHNTSPTAASCGTDLNGSAALDATARIRGRLAALAAQHFADPTTGSPPSEARIRFQDGFVFAEHDPKNRLPFEDLAQMAHFQRISLGERGFYATPGIDFDRETGRGKPFLYFTQGAAVAEVVIDRLTGETRVKRVDLLIDVGNSINPGIDRGQIVGGFIQGMGWVTTEHLRYSAEGELWTHSPTTYKIPNIRDVPEDFRLEFLHGPNCPQSLLGSKALGEPPLLLGLSVWEAIQDAVRHGPAIQPRTLGLPATPERILMALEPLE